MPSSSYQTKVYELSVLFFVLIGHPIKELNDKKLYNYCIRILRRNGLYVAMNLLAWVRYYVLHYSLYQFQLLPRFGCSSIITNVTMSTV